MRSVGPEAARQFEKRVRMEGRAEAEAEWFYRTLGGKVPEGLSPRKAEAARCVEGWLNALPSFHRGAFTLRYAAREWPAALVSEFQEHTSLVVRLECASHPSVGKSMAEVEAASIERLTLLIDEATKERARRKGRNSTPGPVQRQLGRLSTRAFEHLQSAIGALAKVRGDGPCRVAGFVDEKLEDFE